MQRDRTFDTLHQTNALLQCAARRGADLAIPLNCTVKRKALFAFIDAHALRAIWCLRSGEEVVKKEERSRIVVPSRRIKSRHPWSLPTKSPTLSSIIKPSVTVVRLHARRQLGATVFSAARRISWPSGPLDLLSPRIAHAFTPQASAPFLFSHVRKLTHVIAPTMLDQLRNESPAHCFEQGHDSYATTMSAGVIGCECSPVCFEARRGDMDAADDLPKLQH